jgi:tripartite-type tricarboxylate transporter receptor subunit TctC
MLDRRHLIAAAGLSALGARAQTAAPDALASARVLCGFPAGGTTDAVSRRVAEKLQGSYAKTVLVENKPGAGGRLGVEELRRAAPDGSTLLLTPASMITLYPILYSKLSYKTEDVTPVCTACQLSFGFGVGPAVPATVKTLADFLAWAKAQPGGGVSYASPGAGSPPHLLGAMLGKESGVSLNHVPYRGSAPGVQDLLGGQVPAMTSPIGD